MKINDVYKISDRPLIMASTGSLNWSKLKNPGPEKAYLLVHPMWNFSWTSLRLYYKLAKQLKRNGIEMILLHNSEEEYRFGKTFGFRSYLINQNIHACEHNFIIQDELDKEYDASYIAAAKKYKRIHLAEEVDNLFVITYFWPDVRDEHGFWDLHGFEPRIQHAKFNKERISSSEISTILNRSHCGLALSKKEGAMWASMEYLLTGLPIVTTPSIGGRDFFFDDRFVLEVKDKPAAVKEGVEEIKSRKIDPTFVRSETLQKIFKYREKYYELCVHLAQEEAKVTAFPSYEEFSDYVWGGEGIFKLKMM
ncbi:MAG: hypothetical protein AAFR66_24530 [Bacteroidota bacterium]